MGSDTWSIQESNFYFCKKYAFTSIFKSTIDRNIGLWYELLLELKQTISIQKDGLYKSIAMGLCSLAHIGPWKMYSIDLIASPKR